MKKLSLTLIFLLMLCSLHVSATDITQVFWQDFSSMPTASDGIDYIQNNTPARGTISVENGELKLTSNDTQLANGYYLRVVASDNEKWYSGEGTGVLSVKFKMDENTSFVGLGGELITTDATPILSQEANYASPNKNDYGRWQSPLSMGFVKVEADGITVFEEKHEIPVSLDVQHTIDLYVYGDNTYSIYLDGAAVAKDEDINTFRIRYNYKKTPSGTTDFWVENQTNFRGFREIYLMHYAKQRTENPKNCLPSTMYFDDLKIKTGEGKQYYEEYPTVYIDGYQGAETISLEHTDSMPLEIVAEGDQMPVERVTLSVNGGSEEELLEPYSFDASVLGLGEFPIKITAYNSGGLKTEYQVTLKIGKTIQNNLWTETFENYNITGISNGISVVMVGHPEEYAKVEMSDDEYGNSVVIGIDSSKASSDTSRANLYMNIPGNAEKNRLVISFDAKVDGKGNEVRYFMVGLKDSVTSGILESQKIRWADKLYVGNNVLEYDENVWYRYTLDIDLISNTCNVTILDKESGVSENAGSFGLEGLVQLDWIRLYSRRDADAATGSYTTGYMYIDNVSAQAVADVPVITEITGTEYDTEAITFTVSGVLLESSVTTENVKLIGDEGEISLESVSYDLDEGTVTIVPNGRLRSSSTYTITLSKDICVAIGDAIGIDVTESFVTGRQELEVGAPALEGNTMSVTVDNQGTETGFNMIVTIWKGDMFISAQTASYTALQGSTDTYTMTLENSIGADERAELYIWNNLTDKKMLQKEVVHVE